MAEVSNKVRQEAAVRIIGEYKQWLSRVIEEEGEEMQEAARYIAKSRQKVDKIAAEFREEAK